jgi:nitrile hydratase beta subunit
MNGVHDMGGMHGMGPIQYEKNEPVFHAPWEGRMYALNRTMRTWGKWNLDASRRAGELIPPAEYFRMTYYEKWLASLIDLMVESDLVTPAEIESGKPSSSSRATPPVTAANAVATSTIRPSARRNVAVSPRFKVGERVRARNLNPTSHTRLQGRHRRARPWRVPLPGHQRAFPRRETAARLSVRFSARELWGDAAMPQDAVYIDMWDDYLESA